MIDIVININLMLKKNELKKIQTNTLTHACETSGKKYLNFFYYYLFCKKIILSPLKKM